jgi:hypothetical protein
MPRKITYYVHNGSYVEHIGTIESCREFIANSQRLFGTKNLTICVQKNGRYVPA